MRYIGTSLAEPLFGLQGVMLSPCTGVRSGPGGCAPLEGPYPSPHCSDACCAALQVSHHPPICAAHAENANFQYDLVSAPTTRFLGNSLEVFPYGRRLSKGRACSCAHQPGNSAP